MKDFKFKDVASYFDKHLNGQLPWYSNYINSFFPEIARYFARENSTVYDIGASIGNVELAIEDTIKNRSIKFVPIEINNEMVDNYKGNKNNVIIGDITKLDIGKFSFLSSILTLSFIHPVFRDKLILKLKKNCEVGGAIVILEKFHNKPNIVGTLFNRITWRNKIDSNEPIKDIVDKELSLSGVQYPLYDNELDDFELLWAYGDFKSYIYVNRGIV